MKPGWPNGVEWVSSAARWMTYGEWVRYVRLRTGTVSPVKVDSKPKISDEEFRVRFSDRFKTLAV